MRMNRLWQGVRMRQIGAAGDPDGPMRPVTLPVSWDDRAASALAALAPGDGPVTLAAASSPWLSVLAQACRRSGGDGTLAHGIQELLLLLRAAPCAPVWRGDHTTPGFVLNLAAFHAPGTGFDIAGFGSAASLVARACAALAPDARHYAIGIAGLDDLLAAIGLDYDTPAARRVASCLAALFRARVDLALESEQRDLLAAGAAWPAPPRCVIPGLAEAAEAARAQIAASPDAKIAAGVFAPGPAEALLGIETGGIAPAFSPVREGRLSRAALNRLASASLSPEAALAASLSGDTPLPSAGLAAHAAMHEAMSPYLLMMPAHPCLLPAPASARTSPLSARARGKLPARHRGFMQKAAIGGHRVFLRTGEYPDGALGEVDIFLPRENPTMRGMMEAFSQAISLGLQNGVALENYIDAFAHIRFGAAGPVEGDPAVGQASSVLDYVFRSLSATYLSKPLADPEVTLEPDQAQNSPLLPLDLPSSAKGRALRLVA